MGLCKCPRRQVTNLFCYEHRLNVCQHCLVDKHATCVVQSYLEWLQDSDYDPTCPLCKNDLKDSPPDQVVRLQCLHVYHLPCLHAHGQSMPANTAPAGYQCPLCHAAIIPPPNAASPVANALRDQLTRSCNWARQGLGMPILPELDALMPSPPVAAPSPVQEVHHHSSVVDYSSHVGARKTPHNEQMHLANQHYDALMNSSASSKLMMDDGETGEAKYKRRPAMEWLRRWLRSRGASPSRIGSCRRTLLILIVACLSIGTILAILIRIAPDDDRYDPMLDPIANPNIRIGEEEEMRGSHF